MEYKTTIGLEIHVQLKTKSKMFCACGNDADKAKPNSLVCPVCLGLPGVLPVANKQAIEWVILTGLALNSKINKNSKFDRKHYFYPDLPKNYQISQFDEPFCIGGKVGEINLTRIHLEEDAGKLLHANNASLVDLNRAGTPLMEIVTEPEISSPLEAKQFLQELRSILRYLSVTDANMEKGHMRADANISISKCQISNDKCQKLGIPVEIKNINSFRMLERALSYEEKRQKEVVDRGEKIEKETRGWDDAKGVTTPQRSKEFAQDYRYFPEPDLPPFNTEKLFDLEKLKSQIPELPEEKRNRYIEKLKIKPQDAKILASDKNIAENFEKIAEKIKPILVASWIINEIKIENILKISSNEVIELLQKIESGEINNNIAKDILSEMIETHKSVSEIIKNKNIKQIGNEDELNKIIEKILKENPKTLADIHAGKNEARGYIIGLVMRETRGQANPEIVNKILSEKLKNG